MIHAFTVDVEDWYDGIPIAAATKASAERRLERGLNPLLELLAAKNCRATFFILGPIAAQYPSLVCTIRDQGHELGCHGWSHDLIYTMTPRRFSEETRRASQTIEDVTGRPVLAYRAAYFSITTEALWAFDVLAGLGFRYDSSVFPVRNWRYGIGDFNPSPQVIATASGGILEFPLSVRRVVGQNIPACGGAYFRIYPYWFTHANIRHAEQHGRPANFYMHPWELDASHPYVAFNWKAWMTHYVNLAATAPRLERLLEDFSFAPLGEVLEHELARSGS